MVLDNRAGVSREVLAVIATIDASSVETSMKLHSTDAVRRLGSSHAGWLSVLVMLTGCHEVALVPPGGADLASGAPRDMASNNDLHSVVVDMASAPDLAGFCGNPNSPRIDLNGMLAASPAITASQLVLNCCDGATIAVDSMQISTPIAVTWRHQVGQGPNPPITLDLAHLPAGWSVSVVSGCNPAQPNCQPTDQYFDGMTGTLTIAQNGNNGYRMTACMDVAEPANKPHPVIHSLRFWTPPVNTN